MMAAGVLLVAILLCAAQLSHAQVSGIVVTTTAAPAPATIAAIALSIRSRAIQDSRCYLMTGGAVESFFIAEDTPVGATIGTLSVNGDPSEEGDVSLTLQERNAAVGIAPGSKNLTLLRPLDREERAGPSNLYVNVRCDRRRTSDPSFIIPVSVRVWDVNDNPPVWSAASYRARVSELAAPGSRVAAGRATDADQPGPHATVRYSVLPGPHSEYFSFPNELESTLVVAKPLDYESAPNLTVTLRATDGGTPALHADATLFVEVLDADDQNPKFSRDHYNALIPENAVEGTFLEVSPEAIRAEDGDAGLRAPLQYAAAGELRALLLVAPDSARLAATDDLLRRQHFPITVVIKATQVDNPDRYALATVSISSSRARLQAVASGAGSGAESGAGSEAGSGPAGVRFTRPLYELAVSEATQPGATLATLTTTQHYGAKGPLQFYVSDRSFLEKFAINANGEVLLRKQLDYEMNDSYFYQVMVTDGQANDTASLNITVLNVNEWEPRFKHAQYEFRVDSLDPSPSYSPLDPSPSPSPASPPAGARLRVGKLEVFDGDTADTLTLTLRGSASDMFEITREGEMFMKSEALASLNTTILHVVATAVDSGSPPRQSSVPVVVHVSAALAGGAAGAGGAGAGGAGGAARVLAAAAALALLALLVLLLLAYVYRVRRRSKPSPVSSKPSPTVLPPMSKPLAPIMGVGAGVGGTSGSLLSVSAGASTILANSCSSLDLRDTLPTNGAKSATVSRQSQRFPAKTKVAPAPPTLSPGGMSGRRVGGGVGGTALMSNHLEGGGGAGRSGVAWPTDTIPARVKKLSWDDNTNKDGGAEEIHDATNAALNDHMNLTVYF